MSSLSIRSLEHYTNELLNIQSFQDYCPNGLQVEGKPEISRLVSGVTASMDFIKAAAELRADALLVHHGYFWKNETANIVGVKYQRISTLMQHQLNLLAYHLPLDCHPVLGNNAQLAKDLAVDLQGPLYPHKPELPGNIGQFDQPLTLAQLQHRIRHALNREPLIIPGRPYHGGKDNSLDESRIQVQRVGLCTGGAQSYFEAAIAAGVEVFITGEISEPEVHMARESGVTFVAAGHHATERGGAKALGEHLAERFGLWHEFVDIDNPV